jgi:hypothetical protein
MDNIDKEKFLLKHRADVERIKEERERELLLYWENLKPFETPYDVPNIPLVDEETYNNFYIPNLIKAGAIPKKDLIDGQVYIGNHRQCKIAKWNAEKNIFEYWRHKFTAIYIDNCNHFEDDNRFALFVPIKLGTEEEYDKLSKHE